MPKIRVQYTSDLPAHEAFDKVSEFLNESEYLRELDSGYQCDFDSENQSGKVKGKMFSGELKVLENGDGSEVTIEVKFPIILAWAKGKIKSSLEKHLESTLG